MKLLKYLALSDRLSGVKLENAQEDYFKAFGWHSMILNEVNRIFSLTNAQARIELDSIKPVNERERLFQETLNEGILVGQRVNNII